MLTLAPAFVNFGSAQPEIVFIIFMIRIRSGRIPAVVGRPTYLREDQVDPGFVFLFVRSNNPVWWPVIFKSVVQQFPGGQLFLGNLPAKVEAVAPILETLRAFSPIRADLGDLYQKLRALKGVEHKTT